mgnify:CR=1 FL=1
MNKVIAFLFLLLLQSSVFSQVIQTDASKISFKVSSSASIGKTEGTFAGPSGKVKFDINNLSASYFDVKVDASTIETGISLRDNHLKSDDFFYVDKYPYITFTSTSIAKRNSGYLTVGNLTIRNMEKQAHIPFSVSINKNEAVLTGTFTVQRKEFDLGTGFGGLFIGNEVEVTVKTVLKYP